jgi:hypothetical protein
LITRRESVEKRGPAMRAQRCASTLKALPIAMSDEDQNKPAPALGPEVMAAIGRELRRMYAEIIAEGVPERFAEILRKLDEPSNEGETR